MTLRFVYRDGCSLCEAMWSELQELLGSVPPSRSLAPFEIERIDIAGNGDLESRYGTRIPVLEGEGKEICRYFFDADAVREYLSGGPIAV